MKGMLEWLKANTKIKRWIFAILIGVVFACLGISKIIVAKELNVAELLKIVGSFVLGFTLIVVGIISIQKRTLEILIEASDDRLKQEKKVNVNSLIFNKKIYEQDPFAKLDQKGVGSLIKVAIEKAKSTRPNLKLGVCGEHGGDPSSVEFFHNVGLDYVSCSPFRVPVARLAAAQAQVKNKR